MIIRDFDFRILKNSKLCCNSATYLYPTALAAAMSNVCSIERIEAVKDNMDNIVHGSVASFFVLMLWCDTLFRGNGPKHLGARPGICISVTQMGVMGSMGGQHCIFTAFLLWLERGASRNPEACIYIRRAGFVLLSTK